MSKTLKAVNSVAKALDKSRQASTAVHAPLATAARTFGNARAWERIDELDRLGAAGPHVWTTDGPRSEDDRRVLEYRTLVGEERAKLIGRLRSETLIATARDSRQPINAPRVGIPADAWAFLQPEFERSAARGQGFTLEGVEVHVPPEPAAAGTARMERELRRFIVERTKRPAVPVTRSALWLEVQAAVPGASQRAFVRIWRAAAPASWKRPGRKRGRRIDTPD